MHSPLQEPIDVLKLVSESPDGDRCRAVGGLMVFWSLFSDFYLLMIGICSKGDCIVIVGSKIAKNGHQRGRQSV